MNSLDKLDRRILLELDCNSRRPISDISRKIRQGRDRVEYRIERLLERKIVSKFTASVNLAKLGFTIYKLYFRIENDKEAVKALVKHLRSHPRVYWIALSDGSWDLMIAVFARSSVEFFETQRELLSEFNDIILNYAMYQLVELDLYPKGYFTGKSGDVVTVGGAPKIENIDTIDAKILRLLSSNARRSTAEIAEQVNVTSAVVKYRIDRMEKREIITGYRAEIDLAKLDMQFFKSQLFLRNFDSNLQQALRKYCADNPHITYYIQQLGNCSIELEMEVSDYRHYSSIMDDIRSTFPRLVRNFETVLVRKTYFNWVPKDIGQARLGGA
jgi:DNA-binding Lrp family transcriptional regulator